MIRILDVARAQLAIDLNCTEEDLLQEEQIRFCPAAMLREQKLYISNSL